MKLTDQQRAAVEHDGNAIVVACPGSGKTRAIIAKALRCADRVRDTPRRVACITYTNAAVYEIERRIGLYGYFEDQELCEVSTIHSFCHNNILRHFYWQLGSYPNGYTILPPDSDRYSELVNMVSDKHGIEGYPRTQFEMLNRQPNGEPITPNGIPHEAAIEFWRSLEEEGFIDFCNIVYFSYRLARENTGIRRAVAARFRYFLIDEFQDTSALQVELFKLIADEGLSRFFLVGDPAQSIFGFAGADPALMDQFAKRIGAEEFPLSGNHRSSTLIVTQAELLIPRDPAMCAVGKNKEIKIPPAYEHATDNFSAIVDYFLPCLDSHKIPVGDAAILAPTWYQLLPLARELRDYGVPVFGPGARPYKRRSHLFAALAEQICAYIEKPTPQYIRPVEREMFNLILNVTGQANFGVYAFHGRRVVFRLLREGERLRSAHEGAAEWLIAASTSSANILHEEDFIPQSATALLRESAHDILRDIAEHKVDVANLSVRDLGMFGNPRDSLKLMTMHSAKGREFSAVGVISLHDGLVPYHNSYNPLTAQGLESAKRLVYVAITRPKRVLFLFTQAEEYRAPSRFLHDLNLMGVD